MSYWIKKFEGGPARCKFGGRGGAGDVPPRGPKYLKFEAFVHNNLENHMLPPPWQVASPPRGNFAAGIASTLAFGYSIFYFVL